MIEFVEKYKNSEDILKENIKAMKKYVEFYNFFGEEITKEHYPNCVNTIDEIKLALKNARKYLRNLKKGVTNE